MIRRLSVAALALAISAGPLATAASADTAAAVRNGLLITGGVVGAGLTARNVSRKRREKARERLEQRRRQDSYRAFFYRKNGFYPTDAQYREWYQKTYGQVPAN